MSKNKKISITDVAELAGVSPTTVSRVINNSDHPVSKKTREIVEKAVKKLDFQPNRMAQNLINNRSHIVGVIVHDISDEYFGEIVKGIEEIVFDYDYIVNIYNTARDVEKELDSVKMLRANRAEALVFTGGSIIDEHYNEIMSQHLKAMKENGSIIIGITTSPFDIIHFTSAAHKEAGKKITDYLIDINHKKIAYINGPEYISTAQERLKGYKESMQKNNLEIKDDYILSGDFTFESGRRAAEEIIDKDLDITAVIGANDMAALGAIWEFKNQGLNVPEDISVAGIGDIPDAKYAYPPLTTVCIPIYQIGKCIGKYIIKKLEKDLSLPVEDEIKLTIAERESVIKL